MAKKLEIRELTVEARDQMPEEVALCVADRMEMEEIGLGELYVMIAPKRVNDVARPMCLEHYAEKLEDEAIGLESRATHVRGLLRTVRRRMGEE